jgi:hypothetical protein
MVQNTKTSTLLVYEKPTVHYKHLGKEHGECFGMLFVPLSTIKYNSFIYVTSLKKTFFCFSTRSALHLFLSFVLRTTIQRALLQSLTHNSCQDYNLIQNNHAKVYCRAFAHENAQKHLTTFLSRFAIIDGARKTH